MVSAVSMNGASSKSPKLDDVVQLNIVEFLQRRKGLILLGLLVGLVLSGVYLAIANTIYESNAKILVIPKDSKLTTTSNSEFGFESTVGDELLATHMLIISSPKVVRNALETGQLFQLDSLVEQLDSDDLVNQGVRESAIVDYVIEHLSVRRGGDGAQNDAQVLEVTFHHTSDVDASEVLLKIIGSYQDFLGETIQGAGLEAADLIENAGDILDEKLKTLDKDYKSFLKESPMLWADAKNLSPYQVRLTQLEGELANIQVQRAEAESRLEVTKQAIIAETSGDQDPLAQLTVFDGADIDRLSLLIQLDRGYPASESFEASRPERIEAASAKYQQLLTLLVQKKAESLRYGENHPKAQETSEKISELQSVLASYSGQNVSPASEGLDLSRLTVLYKGLLENDVKDLVRREIQLKTLIANEENGAKSLVTFELDANSIRREMDRTQGLYDAVVDRLREINLLKDYGGYITEVISPVRLGEKSWPSIPLVLFGGSILGLLVGSVTGIAAELSDQSFRSPREIEGELGVPILTHVPALRTNVVKEELAGIDPAIVAVHSPKSRQAEIFRGLRTSLLFKAKSVDTPVFQMTSPNAGDGKSTIVSNLAVSISQASKRVLLVDCDMRRPRINKVFGVEQGPGMSELLAGDAAFDDVIINLATNVGVPNLSLIPAGKIPSNPAELLALPSFMSFLDEARSQFDFVLIDSPPVRPVSDPLTIAANVDFVLLGLTLSKHSRMSATHTCEELGSNGGNLLGLVINRTKKAANGNGYGYDGYGYGRYGYGKYSNARYGSNVYGYGGSYEYGYGNQANQEQADEAYYR